MRKVTDLTPRFTNLPPAEQEFITQYNPNELPLGQSAGGLSLYSTKFKRGAGDKVFGNDENGMWLGKADFDGAPFRVDYDGNIFAESISFAGVDSDNSTAAMSQIFTSGTPADVTGSSKSFTLERDTIVFVFVHANAYVYQGSGVGDWGGNGILRLLVDGIEIGNRCRAIWGGGKTGVDSGGGNISSGFVHYGGVLLAGAHNIKLTGQADQISGTTYFNLYDYRLTYIKLGAELS